MINFASAFAPANISLLFKVMPDPNPAKMGSLGAGFTVNEGVTVTVSQSLRTKISFNGIGVNLPTVAEVASTMTDIQLTISISSTLPLGSGFGLSGASALAGAYAINKLLALNKTDLELAKIAHTAEVIHKTGLGDVINQFYGGCFIKTVTSAKFIAHRLPVAPIPIYCRSYGKLLTSSILSNAAMVETIHREADSALARIPSAKSFADLTAIANTFTRATGLMTPKLEKEISSIAARGGHAAMILVGNALVSDIPFSGAFTLHMDSKKAMVLG